MYKIFCTGYFNNFFWQVQYMGSFRFLWYRKMSFHIASEKFSILNIELLHIHTVVIHKVLCQVIVRQSASKIFWWLCHKTIHPFP